MLTEYALAAKVITLEEATQMEDWIDEDFLTDGDDEMPLHLKRIFNICMQHLSYGKVH
jgi:hypothetical protein